MRLESPHLCIAEHYLSWTVIIIGSNAYLPLTIGAIGDADHGLVIYIRGNVIAVCDNCYDVRLTESHVDY